MNGGFLVPVLTNYNAIFGALARDMESANIATCISQCTGCACSCRCSCRAIDSFVEWYY